MKCGDSHEAISHPGTASITHAPVYLQEFVRSNCDHSLVDDSDADIRLDALRQCKSDHPPFPMFDLLDLSDLMCLGEADFSTW
jgi:hypothetical protein